MAKRLTRDELIQTLRDICNPKEFTSEEINHKLYLFAINCPDPVKAMELVVESVAPMTQQELVDKALAYPPRDPRTVPESELPYGNPLRRMKLDDAQ